MEDGGGVEFGVGCYVYDVLIVFCSGDGGGDGGVVFDVGVYFVVYFVVEVVDGVDLVLYGGVGGVGGWVIGFICLVGV